MVPWHPPCALISLIFSSLDPETNCFRRFIVVCFLFFPSFQNCFFKVVLKIYLLLRFATGLIIESFSVQLSRCSFDGFPSSGFVFANPESDTEPIRNPSTVSVTRLASLADLHSGIQLASGSSPPCLCCPVAAPSQVRLSSDLIDLRMKPLRFRFGLLLRKEVIQPHLPIRLPCYDFTPVIGLALGG